MTNPLLSALPQGWTAHGLRFACEADSADVTVRVGPVPASLSATVRRFAPHDVADGDFLMRIGPEIRVRSQEGRSIVVDAPQNSDPGDLARWILGPATTAILYQRSLLALHASAVVLWNRAVAFLAPSGTGKSSLASALVADGGCFLTDDLLAVRPAADGALSAFPSGNGLRVPPETWDLLDQHRFELVRLDPDNKRLVRPTAGAMTGPRPLAGVFFLEIGEAVQASRLDPFSTVTRLRSLMSLPKLARRLGAEAACFQVLGAIASQVPAWHLTRPAGENSLSELVSTVKRCLAGGAATHFRSGVVPHGQPAS